LDAAEAEAEGVAEAVVAVHAEEVEEARGAEAAPEEVAIALQPEAEAALGVLPDLGEAARGQAEVGEVEVARVPAGLAPAAAADFVAELPVALEGAEELAAREVESAAGVDLQLCHLAAMSLVTDRVVLGIGPVAPVVSVIDRVDPAVSETGRVDPVALRIGRAASIAQGVSAIEQELGIDPVPVGQLGPVLEQGWRIDPGEATAHSWEIASETAATDSGIVAISRTTAGTAGTIALKIAVIVSRTDRRTEAIVSTIAAIASRTGGTVSRIVEIDWKTVVTG
jgi:hypothetical protein